MKKNIWIIMVMMQYMPNMPMSSSESPNIEEGQNISQLTQSFFELVQARNAACVVLQTVVEECPFEFDLHKIARDSFINLNDSVLELENSLKQTERKDLECSAVINDTSR